MLCCHIILSSSNSVSWDSSSSLSLSLHPHPSDSSFFFIAFLSTLLHSLDPHSVNLHPSYFHHLKHKEREKERKRERTKEREGERVVCLTDLKPEFLDHHHQHYHHPFLLSSSNERGREKEETKGENESKGQNNSRTQWWKERKIRRKTRIRKYGQEIKGVEEGERKFEKERERKSGSNVERGRRRCSLSVKLHPLCVWFHFRMFVYS